MQNTPLFCMVSRVHMELLRGNMFYSTALQHLGTGMRALYLLYTPFGAAKSVPRAKVSVGSSTQSRSCAVPVYQYLVDDAFALNVRKSNIPCRDFATALLFRAKPWLFKGKFDAYQDGTTRETGVVSPSSSVVGPFEADLLARAYTAEAIDNEVNEVLKKETESLRRTESSDYVKKIVLKQRKIIERNLGDIIANNGEGYSKVNSKGKNLDKVSDCLVSEFCK